MTLRERDACPECGSKRFKKNGHIHNGKQNHQCKTCGRQFVVDATNRVIDAEQRSMVERLLCEKISLHGICRAIGVSIRWLMDFMVARFAALPDHFYVQPVASSCDIVLGCLEVEADELWSFVQKKAHTQWLWIALDKQTRQILAFYVGDRSRDSAKQLWQNIPEVYWEQATFYTDQYAAYLSVIPAAQHQAITKLVRKTNHVERFNYTLRQSVPAGAQHAGVLQKNGQPRRCDSLLHLSLQSHQSSIACITLPAYQRTAVRITSAGQRGSLSRRTMR
jgi:insertion element IS1 protein InsB